MLIERKLLDTIMIGDLSQSESVVIIDLTDENLGSVKHCENVSLVSGKKDGEQLETEKETTNTLYKRRKYHKLFRKLENPQVYTRCISNEDELLDIFSEKYKRGSDVELCSKKNENLYTEILEETICNYMKISEAVSEIIVIEECKAETHPQLTPKMQQMVAAALRQGPQTEVLVEAFNLKITRHDIGTLKKNNWLNCQVTNFYMSLISERGKQKGYPSVYTFSTFFFTRLFSSGYSAVRRWTRKVDVFAYEILIVPVHLKVHWCVVAINFKKNTISYYDSMNSSNDVCLWLLWDYLNSESMDKRNRVFSYDGWKMENVKEIPQQLNASDCGVFTCAYAECICRNASFNFSQEDMPYFRQKLVYEILSKKLMS